MDAADHTRDVLEINLPVWRATTDRLSLNQTGRLMRSLRAAKTVKRPTREQKLLLALYTNVEGSTP